MKQIITKSEGVTVWCYRSLSMLPMKQIITKSEGVTVWCYRSLSMLPMKQIITKSEGVSVWCYISLSMLPMKQIITKSEGVTVWCYRSLSMLPMFTPAWYNLVCRLLYICSALIAVCSIFAFYVCPLPPPPPNLLYELYNISLISVFQAYYMCESPPPPLPPPPFCYKDLSQCMYSFSIGEFSMYHFYPLQPTPCPSRV